ncbi:MAG: hypothetical protein ACKVVT_02265 [Dehalococcoidia bacterium]
MDRDLAERMAAIAAECGFETGRSFCASGEMVAGIRAAESLPEGASLNDALARALLENLRLVILRSAANRGAQASLAEQAQLHRWKHLRPLSSQAADAYAAVLRYPGVEVPECLMQP